MFALLSFVGLFLNFYCRCDSFTMLISNNSCSVRYSYLDQIARNVNCTAVKEANSLCGREIRVLYSNLRPYIYLEDGNVTGILPEILKQILVKSCCFGCNTIITYTKTDNIVSRIISHEKISKFDVLIPVENCLGCSSFLGHEYTDLMQLEEVLFVGKTKAPTTEYLTTVLIESTANTWPLFVVALALAVCAGTIIWIMDTWFNKKEFPRQFPKGPFEGFWWAYVSMTTVGYGDRTPHSVPARLFAVVWILIGMIIFNMYTACITSLLTSKISEEGQNSIYMRKIGVLEDLKAIYSGIAIGMADHSEYSNMEDLQKDLQQDKIPAIAMESHMLAYYLSEEIGDKYTIYKQVQLKDNAIGLVSYHPQIIQLIKSFKMHNRDAMNIIVSNASKIAKILRRPINELNRESTFTLFSSKSDAFYITMAVTAALSVLCIILGTFLAQTKKEIKKRKSLRDSRSMTSSMIDRAVDI